MKAKTKDAERVKASNLEERRAATKAVKIALEKTKRLVGQRGLFKMEKYFH